MFKYIGRPNMMSFICKLCSFVNFELTCFVQYQLPFFFKIVPTSSQYQIITVFTFNSITNCIIKVI
jgi:hypothetical protein